MTTVSIKASIAKDLIETKLTVIRSEIEAILKTWGQKSAKEMIEKARRGELPESEMDAIALTNLLDKREELEELMKNIGG